MVSCNVSHFYGCYYHPQTKFGARLYFAPVCHSVHRGEYLGRYSPGPGTPPGRGASPVTKYTPWDKVHPLGPGTPPGPGTLCPGPGTPSDKGDTATSGRYASYWNALLLPPATKLGQGYVFTASVILLTGGGST